MAAGIAASVLCGVIGIYVILNRIVFISDGIAHAAFGGIALGLLLSLEPLWIAVPFTVIVALLITLLRDKTKLEIDTSIGILFAVSVALGIIFISVRKEYSADAFAFLF